MKQCLGSLRWVCQYQRWHSSLDTRMWGNCLDILTSTQQTSSRSIRRFRTIQRRNDRWHKWVRRQQPGWPRLSVRNRLSVPSQIAWFWKDPSWGSRDIMRQETSSRRWLRQPRTGWNPYLRKGSYRPVEWVVFHHSSRCLYCIYRLRKLQRILGTPFPN